jgi:hypothetical protein
VSIVGAIFSALRGSEYDARQAKTTGL